MMENAKEWTDRMKQTLGQEKFNELAALILERKVDEASPMEVKQEIENKFGVDAGAFEFLPVFIKY